MNRDELKNMVAQLLRDMGEPVSAAPTESVAAATISAGEIPDITAVDLRKQYLVANPADKAAFLELKARTPARIGLGRAGARYKTETMLRFRADHAAAQDSVFSDVPEEFAAKNNLIPVQTMCKDKDEYLTRPDLGRRFDEENQAIIKKACGTSPKILLVVGDGLSSTAIETNAMDCLKAIKQGLQASNLTSGDTLFIKYARVGASDHIGSLTDAEIVCMLVGERPGLVTAESMSAYITYGARIGVPESQRTVVSNIHAQGTPAIEAGAHIATLLKEMLARKCSGVALRQEVGA